MGLGTVIAQALGGGSGIALADVAAALPQQALATTQPRAVRTTSALSSPMASFTPPAFAPLAGLPGYDILIDSADRRQPFFGVGAAITQSTAFNLMTNLTASQRQALLQQCFAPGSGFSMVRVCMGDSDYTTNYASAAFATYDDVPSDTTLANFSIAKDLAYVVPVLQQILAISPRTRIKAAPWSPPAWMKYQASPVLTGGNMNSANFSYLAQYFVKFLQAYAALGIPIWAVSPQNEPGVNTAAYPSCTWAAADLASFIGSYLGPALDTAGFQHVTILACDDTWQNENNAGYVSTALASATASPYVGGAAYHAYYGSGITQLQRNRVKPSVLSHMTEMSRSNTGNSAGITNIGGKLVDAIRSGASSYILWNLLLDENYGPGPATSLVPVVSAPTSGSGVLTYFPEYYILMHIAKFVKPGAFVCKCNTFAQGSVGADIETVGFANPDGSTVLFLLNLATSTRTVTVIDALSQLASPVTLAAGDMVTMTWGPAQNGGGSIAAPGAAASFNAIQSNSVVSLAFAAPSSPGGTALGGYLLSRGLSSSALTPLAALAPGATSYVDSAVTIPNTYYYGLTPFGGGGPGPAATASVALAPVAPSNVQFGVSASSAQAVTTFSAQANGAAISSFTVQRATVTGGTVGSYSTVGTYTTNSSATSGTASGTYADTTVSSGTTYSFQVIANSSPGNTTSAAVQVTPQAALLLDGLATLPAAVYSTRKLVSAYAGSCMLVRRSSDSTTTAIGFVNNNLDTTALLTFAGSGSAYVQTWYDQSGNGHDATQSTAASQPQIVNAGVLRVINSQPALWWQSTSSVAQSLPTFKFAAPSMNWSFSDVVQYQNSSSYDNVFTDGAGYQGSGIYMALNSLFFSKSGTAYSAALGTTTPAVNTPQAIVGVYSSANSFTGYKNNEAATTTSVNSSWTTGGWGYTQLGAYGTSSTSFASTQCFQGYLTEHIAWNGALSTTDANTVVQNQRAYWGTP